MSAIAEFLPNFRLIRLQTRSENNGTDSHIIFFIFIIEINGISITHFFAFATDTFIEKKAVISVYSPGIGYCLGEKSINCSSFIKSLVKNIKDPGGTFFFTGTTARTFISIYISGFLFKGNRKVTCLPGNFFYLCQSVHFNIGMSAGLNHARRNHTHGTISGGKRFVQSGHRATN